MQVDEVTLWRQGIRVEGSLHLTAHHFIFRYTLPDPTTLNNGIDATIQPPKQASRQRELWITYPMINSCVFKPAPPASHQAPSIRIRCRDFVFVRLDFVSESKAREVYDTIRSLTCKLGRLEKLYAFSYEPPPTEKKFNGWEIYDAEKELRRLGVGGKNPECGWRVSHINSNYEVSTFPIGFGGPHMLTVLTVLSDIPRSPCSSLQHIR
jgi:myotubularin-related protein 6/7/8